MAPTTVAEGVRRSESKRPRGRTIESAASVQQSHHRCRRKPSQKSCWYRVYVEGSCVSNIIANMLYAATNLMKADKGIVLVAANGILSSSWCTGTVDAHGVSELYLGAETMAHIHCMYASSTQLVFVTLLRHILLPSTLRSFAQYQRNGHGERMRQSSPEPSLLALHS